MSHVSDPLPGTGVRFFSPIERTVRWLGFGDERRGAAIVKVASLIGAIIVLYKWTEGIAENAAESAAKAYVRDSTATIKEGYTAAMHSTVNGFVGVVSAGIAQVSDRVELIRRQATQTNEDSTKASANAAAAVAASLRANENATAATTAAENVIEAATRLKEKITDADAKKIIDAIARIEAAEAKLRSLEARVPVGTIVAYAAKQSDPPTGWLFCDGHVELDSKYPDLSAALTTTWGEAPKGSFRIPDLRGMFLRGANNGREDEWKDPDNRAVGVPQWFGTAAPAGTNGSPKDDPAKCIIAQREINATPNDGGGHAVVNGNAAECFPVPANEETRPKNVAVNWIIKY